MSDLKHIVLFRLNIVVLTDRFSQISYGLNEIRKNILCIIVYVTEKINCYYLKMNHNIRYIGV
jgi:septum formation topological specificity factor MinE